MQYDVAVQKERSQGHESKLLEREAAQLEAGRKLQQLQRELEGHGELMRAALEEHKRQMRSAVGASSHPFSWVFFMFFGGFSLIFRDFHGFSEVSGAGARARASFRAAKGASFDVARGAL